MSLKWRMLSSVYSTGCCCGAFPCSSSTFRLFLSSDISPPWFYWLTERNASFPHTKWRTSQEAIPLYIRHSLDFLDIAFTAFVLDRTQWSPLSLHCRIGFHLHLCLSPLDAVLLIDRNQVGKEERIGTFGTLLRKDTDQQEIDDLGLVELDGT